MHTVTLKRLVSLVKNLLVSTVMSHKLIQLIIYSFTIHAYTLADLFIAQERPGSAWTVEVSKKFSVILTSMEASYLVCVCIKILIHALTHSLCRRCSCMVLFSVTVTTSHPFTTRLSMFVVDNIY